MPFSRYSVLSLKGYGWSTIYCSKMVHSDWVWFPFRDWTVFHPQRKNFPQKLKLPTCPITEPSLIETSLYNWCTDMVTQWSVWSEHQIWLLLNLVCVKGSRARNLVEPMYGSLSFHVVDIWIVLVAGGLTTARTFTHGATFCLSVYFHLIKEGLFINYRNYKVRWTFLLFYVWLFTWV